LLLGMPRGFTISETAFAPVVITGDLLEEKGSLTYRNN